MGLLDPVLYLFASLRCTLGLSWCNLVPRCAYSVTPVTYDAGHHCFVLLLLLFSRQVVSDYSWPHGLQHARRPCPSPSPGVCPSSCPLNQWCQLTISFSATPFSSCPQSFPASESFPVSQLCESGGQSIGASAWESVLPMSIQGWFPLGLPGLISLQFKGLSGVLPSTTVRKHEFFSVYPSLWSSSHIRTWLLERP